MKKLLIINMCLILAYSSVTYPMQQALTRPTNDQVKHQAEETYNKLLASPETPLPHEQMSILCSVILNAIESKETPKRETDLTIGVLPEIKVSDVWHRTKVEAHDTLVRMLQNTPEFTAKKNKLLPNIVIQDGQLSLEQILYLYYVFTRKPVPMYRGINNSHHKWILYHPHFKTMPLEIQHQLLALHKIPCKNYLSKDKSDGLAIFSLAMLLATVFLAEKYRHLLPAYIAASLHKDSTSLLSVLTPGIVIFSFMIPALMLGNHLANKEIESKFGHIS